MVYAYKNKKTGKIEKLNQKQRDEKLSKGEATRLDFVELADDKAFKDYLKRAEDDKKAAQNKANNESKDRYIIANGKFDKSGYDDGTRYTTVSDTPPKDGKSYIKITGTLDEAKAEMTRLNQRLNAGDRAQQEAISSPAGTAKDDQLENQTAQNTAKAVMKGQSSADADITGAKDTVNQKKLENKVNPNYVKGENQATPTDVKNSIEAAAGEKLPGSEGYDAKDAMDETAKAAEMKDTSSIPDLGDGVKPKTTENNEQPEDDDDDNNDGQTPPPPPGPENKSFWDRLKKYGAKAYPTLKAVTDMISKNARMNLDRAALLTGGQRDLDAYTPIETETDKIREAQVDTRAKSGTTVEEAMAAFRDDGDITGIQNLVASGDMTMEQAAQATNLSVESLGKVFDGQMTIMEAQAQDAKLQTEKGKQELIRGIDEQIANIDETIKANNEMIRALAGHDYDAFIKATGAWTDLYGGRQTAGSAHTDAKADSAQGNIGGKAGNGAIGIEGGIGGSHNENVSTTTTSSTDTLILQHMNEIINAGKDAMKSQDEANQTFVDELTNYNTELANRKRELQAEKTRIKNNTKDYGTGKDQKKKSTKLDYTAQPKENEGEAQQ